MNRELEGLHKSWPERGKRRHLVKFAGSIEGMAGQTREQQRCVHVEVIRATTFFHDLVVLVIKFAEGDGGLVDRNPTGVHSQERV